MIAWTAQETGIVALAVVVVFALAFGRGLTFKAGSISARLDSIDKAVNTRPNGEPTISEDVRHMRATLGEVVERLAAVESLAIQTAQRVGALEHPGETS